ncbi:hypothetical protein DEJ21_14340 [Curtobacterium sp. MCSS17_006]|uniref:SGNH/GDSL hydrolase family protein n=1 Tax=Curtobacterium sp. MCSS17_006 TaxID=2175642 RepID=UPI000DA6E9D4|nr:SGNH/GDSL hydrolase family protein [Curtobacterium sp. MCSS17_006]PZE34025.1 hypothetical protein DEJ21_14340 [Curtobacterium sp. MCSS17_006]
MGNFIGWFERSYKGIIIVLVAIMAITLVALAFQRINESKPAAGAEPGPIPTFTSDATAEPSVVWLGDSYTAGAGASSPEKAYPALVSAEKNWRSTVVGCGGSGYVNNGTCHENYAVRVADVIKAAPDVVIVSGGRNDVDFPATQVAENANTVLSKLQKQLPDAKVYVTSPVWDDDAAPRNFAELQSAVRASAEEHGATYLEIGEPLAGHADEVIADGVHPNDKGYRSLADAITKALPAT